MDFDIWVKGSDNVHSGILAAIKWCEENGKEVVTLPRTEGISSTYIKRLISDFSANEKEKINE